MKKTIALVAMAASLSACSGLDAVKAGAGLLSDDKGTKVSASAQVGKEANQQVIAGDQNKTETNVEAENATVSHVRQDKTASVTGEVAELTVNNLGDIPIWMILFAVLGWMLPTPTEMGKGLSRILFPWANRKVTDN